MDRKFVKLEDSSIRSICIKCGLNPQSQRGYKKYRSLCWGCHRKRYSISTSYDKFKKSICEECGFIPVHSCQLDVDHINGNHLDNTESNLQTLCANCHRLKTLINKDWVSNQGA